ncbi:hypothetical protein, partial [Roseibium polysiphoniae]|uniref:hypothetical protein n=1 Tax=Roseibium polysiphoniae TaxID=2571221 RepID=UPI0032997ACC
HVDACRLGWSGPGNLGDTERGDSGEFEHACRTWYGVPCSSGASGACGCGHLWLQRRNELV